MRILGVHDGHNSAACMYEDGVLKAAVQEERLNGIKNWSGIPEGAIRAVLELTGCGIADVDRVAMNGHHMPYSKDRQEIMAEYHKTGSLQTSVKKFLRHTFLKTVYQERRKRQRTEALKQLGFSEDRVVFVEHHTAHASAAYYGLANFEDDVLVLTNDGAGDHLCATVSVGRNGKLERIAEIPESESIGNLYAMVTFLLGMVPLEHEFKLMGMAPYAHSDHAEVVYKHLMELMAFDKKNPLVWHRTGDCPETYFSYDFLRKLLELKRFDAICAGLQRFTEEMLVTWVQNCVAHTGVKKIAVSGGVFMNVKVNQAILALPEVESLFVYPSCGDETNAMGAAYWTYAQQSDVHTMKPLDGFYLGRSFEDEEILKVLEQSEGIQWERVENIEAEVARLLHEGQVVARFKGKAEFGARALGNRSLLADPCQEDVVREINDMIKSRDFWMPFAPSMLSDAAEEYLVNPKGASSPYMMLAFDTTDKRMDLRAAIHPYDFTARAHIVTEAGNPDYSRLIGAFREKTGRGVILNTSFNLHGYPIVDTPQDAVYVLANSGLRNLAIGNYLVRKR
ncbi:MAG: hypothetical protein O2954_15845 [bacterium]|nr:hypothetical protein [bacterium]